MKLEEIANISIGITVNREKDENGKNTYKLFSLKNYEENQEYEEFKTDKNLDSRLSKEGDLLFRLIYPNKIIYVDDSLKDMIIPLQLCIIRADYAKIDPIVLKWYLESRMAREQILTEVTGTTIQSIPVSALRKIEVPEISKENQEKIKKLVELWEDEKKVTLELIEKKEKLYEDYIEEIMRLNY